MTNTFSSQRLLNDVENQWRGDEIPAQRDPNRTRIMFHNIRRLPLHGPDGVEMFIHAQSQLQIDLQGFSEHCLDTSKFQIYQKVKDILRTTQTEQATIQLNSSMEEATNQYKPGGTGILILGHLASRLEPQGKGGDTLGRWSYVHFQRKNLPPVTIISVYQVCPRPTNIIGNTAYHQQTRQLHMSGRYIHPRKAFIDDLHVLLQSLLSKHHDIIIGGDFNESFHDRNSGLLQLATTHNLTDPFFHKFPTHEEFGTHINGHRRIDVTLVTPRILESLQSVGYAPFEFATPSDHRPLVLEFDSGKLFGKKTAGLTPKIHRGVKSKDKASVRTFISHTFAEIQKKNGFQLQSHLDDDSATPELAELIDTIIGTSEHCAEKKCRRRRPEFYSRTIAKQRLEVSLLTSHLNALKKNRDRYPQLRQKMIRTGVEFELPATHQLARTALQEARLRLQETTQQQFNVRQAELQQTIQSADADNDRPRAQRLSAIKKAESGQKTYNILKAMKNKSTGTQYLDRVEIPQSWPPPDHPVESLAELEDPKTCKEWRLVTAPNEVEYYLMLRNRLHFGQAQGTPFTQPPLQNDFDWPASSAAAERALNGSYYQTLSTPQCTELLAACKARTNLDSITHEMTLAEFRGKIRSWRESTTTSPSGRHLGRYKALFKDMVEDENSDGSDSQAPNLATQQESIARLKLSLMNYCIRNTYVLERWKTVVNVMIFKEHSNFKIHRLRIIHIYEADFNALLAIKWRQLLHFADRNVLLHPGQYGGRPGCEAQSLTLLEELKYDLSYLTRRSLFNFDNDATSCYDRILVPLASLINRKYGLDRHIVSIHAETLRQANFRLKTLAGVSDISYRHSHAFPIHGTGQGSGNSPCIWLFISSTLFDIHESQAHGATFISPDGSTRVHLSMVGFVDDSTGSCNDFQPSTQQPLQNLFQRMQRDAQLWNDLLYCSGGKLELPKCSFHVLHFNFLPNGKPIPSIEQFDNHIHIRDAESQTSIPIPSKRSFETHKTLGHQKSPFTSTPKREIQELQKKAERIAILIATSPIPRHGALLAYHTIFVPSIKYTLPQSFFPQQSLDQAQRKSIQHIIAKCGYNRNTARALIYAPINYAGGGFLPWYMLQGEGQVLHFLKHWRTQTVVSSTLRIAVHWAQWYSGHHSPIFEDVNYPIPYLDCRWLRSLRTFLNNIRAAIHLDISNVASCERSNDIYIMNYARECGLFNEHDIAIINYCRLFLHVTTVSELYQPDGLTLIPDLFHCRRESWFNPDTYVSLQRRPSEYHIRTKWQKLCRQWTTSNGFLAASVSLGSWTTSGENLRRRRETYITTDATRSIYHWRHGSYWEYHQSDDHPNVFIPARATTWVPSFPCVPVYAQEITAGAIMIRQLPKKRKHILTANRPIRNFDDYIQSLPAWEQHLLQNIVFHFGPYEIVHRISTPTAGTRSKIFLVSDGSQRDDDLTYGWVCGSDEGTIYAENSGFGYGSPSSHRAEAWGMLSAVLFLHHLEVYTRTPDTPFRQCFIEAYSDNSGLITRLKQRSQYSTSYPNSTLQPDWELVEQIHTLVLALPAAGLSFHWVKGHQDDTTNQLPIAAQYNIRADELAGAYLISPRTRHQFSDAVLPVERCRLIIDGNGISGRYTTAIRQAYTLPPFFKYLTQRHQWSQATLNNIDWKAYTHAARNSKINSIQLLKLVHDKLPTGYEKAKANPHANPRCYYCDNLETFAHVLKCPNPVSQQFRQTLKDQLNLYFFRNGTPDTFRDEFIHCTDYWLQETNSRTHPSDSTALRSSQQEIGWNLLPKGFLSIQWRYRFEQIRQHQDFLQRRSSIDFLAGIIQIIWRQQLQLWTDHLSALGKLQNKADTPRSLESRQEHSIRIRLLHAKREQCLYVHRDIYFHQDIDKFLQEATITQMREYLLHYEPAIQQSIKDAHRIPMRSIFTFQGFSHRQAFAPHQSPNPPTVPPQSKSRRTTQLLDREGVSFPHKHTRWKSGSHTRTKNIREFFSSNTPP